MTEVQHLEFIDSVLWIHTRNSYTAMATKHFLYWQFFGWPEEQREKLYKNHPANTHLASANEALAHQSIVGAYEHILSHNKPNPLPVPQDDVEELRKHRHVISHSATVSFRDPVVQEFYAKGGQYRDPATQRLWRIRQALLTRLTDLGSDYAQKYPSEVTVQLGTCELIHSTMCLVYQDSQPKPDFQEISKLVFEFFGQFQEALANNHFKPK